MQRAVNVPLALLLTLLLFWATGARAEDEVLKLVPEHALGFVVVNRPAEADAKLQQLGREMKLPIPSLLSKLRGPGGIHEGVDQNRPMAMLAMPPKDDKSFPTMIALVPVLDYAKFLEQFKSEGTEGGVTKVQVGGVPSAVRGIGGYAAFTDLSLHEILKDVKLADEVPAVLAPWRTWLAEKDAALVMLAPGIRLLSAKVQQTIAGIKPALAQAGGQMKQAAAGLDIYVMLFQATEKEVASIGFGVQRDSDGVLRLAKRARLVPGGNWAAFFAELKPAKHNVLTGLPDGPFVFAGGGPLSEAAMHKLMDFSFGMVKNLRDLYGLSEEQSKTLSKLAQEKFPGIRGVSFVLGASQSGESILWRMSGIMRVKNSETFLVDYEKYLTAYNQIAEKVKSPMFQPIQLEKTEIDGARGLKITMSVPQMPNMPPESVKMMERMYGPGGKILAWIVPCNEHTVVISYMSPERLQHVIALIKQGKPGLAADAEVAGVTALLPSGTTWSGYLSPKGMFDMVVRVMVPMLPPGTWAKFPEFRETPPIAVALTTGPDDVESHLIVPAEVLKAIGEMVGSKGETNRKIAPPPKKVEER